MNDKRIICGEFFDGLLMSDIEQQYGSSIIRIAKGASHDDFAAIYTLLYVLSVSCEVWGSRLLVIRRLFVKQ